MTLENEDLGQLVEHVSKAPKNSGDLENNNYEVTLNEFKKKKRVVENSNTLQLLNNKRVKFSNSAASNNCVSACSSRVSYANLRVKESIEDLRSDSSDEHVTPVAASGVSTTASLNSDSFSSRDGDLTSDQELSPSNALRSLPMWKKHKDILRSVKENQVTIIIGEPGSGKTTQVPQMLLEEPNLWSEDKTSSSSLGMIAITQPRRVAAISLATRVLEEIKHIVEGGKNFVSPINKAQYRVNNMKKHLAQKQQTSNRSTSVGLSTDTDKTNKTSLNQEETLSSTYYTLGGLVGYSVRFQHKVSKLTKLKFLTDGCLLREAIVDPLLRRYRIIIIDEAHERSIRTDILLGLLKLLLKKRGSSLRIIIMSATLDYQVFLSFFKQGNVILCPGRQYSVTIHNTLQSQEDYLEGVVNTILQLHLSKPLSGDILAFLAGQDEIESAKRILEERIKTLYEARKDFVAIASVIPKLKKVLMHRTAQNEFFNNNRGLWETNICNLEMISDTHLRKFLSYLTPTQFQLIKLFRSRLKEWISHEKGECVPGTSAPLFFNPEHLQRIVLDMEDSLTNSIISVLSSELRHNSDPKTTIFSSYNKDHETNISYLWDMAVLPLYAALPVTQQTQVFEAAPTGTRKVILSTNIAETSVTVPGVKYIVDSGVYKVKNYNPISGVESLTIQTISRAMANQRTGRAGREGPGEAYRLYTEQDYYNMDVQAEPEIKRTSLSQVILELKAMGVNDIKAFPFLSPPSNSSVDKALQLLKRLEALDEFERLTEAGKKLAAIPVSPEWGKFLLNSVAFGCTSEALTVVAIMNSDPIWTHESSFRFTDGKNSERQLARKKILCTDGDHLTAINAFIMWNSTVTNKVDFCNLMGLNHRSLLKAKRIREQLKETLLSPKIGLTTISSCLRATELNIDDKDITFKGGDAIRCCLVKSFPWYIARLSSENVINKQTTTNGCNKNDYSTAAYMIETSRTPVSIHPSSGLFGRTNKPEFVVFSELIHTSKLYMRMVTAVNGDWLPRFHSSLFVPTSSSFQRPNSFSRANEGNPRNISKHRHLSLEHLRKKEKFFSNKLNESKQLLMTRLACA